MVYVLGQPFPKIPLALEVPGSFPDIEKILSVSVEPRLNEVKLDKREVELSGAYSVEVKYCGLVEDQEPVSDNAARGCQCFFGHLCVVEGGFLEETEGVPRVSKQCRKEGLFKLTWDDVIHTYIEVKNSKFLRQPLHLIVDRCELNVAEDQRKLKGYLVLKLEK